ncbi:GUSB [Cordylochernes scorpioides]|uniref:Beta-glucuronidase n=1 Tax=Cordylochernes scorpioides TaxID=51811 RepID=A0ABY6KJ54_9ARAC|nr:GUSB [Cordylochernes scorpioides]
MLLLWAALLVAAVGPSHQLQPRESLTRELRTLDGLWAFRISPWNDPERGLRERWYARSLSLSGAQDVIPIAVPGSFNDQTQNTTIRDFIGWVWYEKDFYVPSRWLDQDRAVLLRFGGAHYYAQVYVNGAPVVNHTGGHLPFQADVTNVVKSGLNRVSVALNNTLSPDTIPQGQVIFPSNPTLYPPGYKVQAVNFDFYNYAGIHRSVVLYSVPSGRIVDITVITDVQQPGNIGLVQYKVNTSVSTPQCRVTLYNKYGWVVARQASCSSNISISSANLWWPYTMNPKSPGYMYTMQVSLYSTTGGLLDEYIQPVGIRSIQVTNSSFLINHRPFYFTGFGKHEDSNIRGKGLDYPLIIKDFNLIRWIGANSFRTSHYPYSEEMMDQADQQGVVVIDECPAVSLERFKPKLNRKPFGSNLLNLHLQMLTELIERDKNRPSVVMWSIANEPLSGAGAAKGYFKRVVALAKSLDSSRPVTAAINQDCATDQLGPQLDVAMINRYLGWYSDTGHPEVIPYQLPKIMDACHQTYQIPILMSEYGADTIAGMHRDPAEMFTEEFQAEYFRLYHQTFDVLRQNRSYWVGEMVWNFADFATMPSLNRVVGNKKGIFTRERQPKMAAFVLRKRYRDLANLTTYELPSI